MTSLGGGSRHALRLRGMALAEDDARLRERFARLASTAHGETRLTCDLVLHPPPQLAPFPYLYRVEWEVVPGRSQDGTGDLVFTDGEGAYVVVEVKSLDETLTGPTARRRRNRKRAKVEEQALRYATRLRAEHPDAQVAAAVYTNDPLGGGFRWVDVPPVPVRVASQK